MATNIENLIKVCEGMTIRKFGDGFSTCPVTYYFGRDYCLMNHPNSKEDIQSKYQCPLYMHLSMPESIA